MKPKVLKDVAASVRARLTQMAKQRGEQAHLLMERYALERLLFRLSRSEHRDRFVLKGATLFSLWGETAYRATRDLDLLGLGDNSPEAIVGVFRGLCALPTEDDGLQWLPDSVRTEPINAADEYVGVRTRLDARLGRARLSLQVDVGFGDALGVEAEWTDFPVLLGEAPIRIRAYARETVVAEKTEIVVTLGMVNSRLKDYWDLWMLASKCSFQGALLAECIRLTFHRRNAALLHDLPIGLSVIFETDPVKKAQWQGFVRKTAFSEPPPTLDIVCRLLRDFLLPPLSAIRDDRAWQAYWSPGGPWREANAGSNGVNR